MGSLSNIANSSAIRFFRPASAAARSDVPSGMPTIGFPKAEGSVRYRKTRRPARDRGFKGWQAESLDGVVGAPLFEWSLWEEVSI